jgi:hypothetical protein
VNVLLSAPSWSYEDSRGILTDSLAYSLLVPSLIESELDSTEREDLQDFLEWSQPGSNRRPPACKADRFVHSCLVVSRKAPANLIVLLDTRGHDRTARDNLMHPWCTLSVA